LQLFLGQDIDVYLYDTNTLEKLSIWTYSGEAQTFKWQDLVDCIMKYMDQNSSGSYIFGLYEDDLIDGNYIISKKWNCSGAPCQGCDGTDVLLYNQWSRYTTFRNIQVPARGLNPERNLFDLETIAYDSATNWGMNFSISVRCDLTDYVIKNIYQWADPLAVQICKEMLEDIANGIRIGPSPAQTKLSAIAALDEKAPGNWITKTGGYNDTIQALNLDLSGFSKACMPCETKGKGKNYIM